MKEVNTTVKHQGTFACTLSLQQIYSKASSVPYYGIIGHVHFSLGEMKIVLSKKVGKIFTHIFFKDLIFFPSFYLSAS